MPAGNPGGYKKFGDPKSGVKKMSKGKATKGKKGMPPWLKMSEGKAAKKKTTKSKAKAKK